jgi:hypothetical protein
MCTDEVGTAHLHQPDPQVLRFGQAFIPSTVGTRFQLCPAASARLERRAHCRRS